MNMKTNAMNMGRQLSRSQEIATKVPVLFRSAQRWRRRLGEQIEGFDDNLSRCGPIPASAKHLVGLYSSASTPHDRSVGDTMRQRGNNS